jgi:hypothetical protein
MAGVSIRAQVAKIRERLEREARAESPLLDRLRRDPVRILTEARLTPDPWQANVLRSPAHRLLLLCSRQAGKSTTSAALALQTALLRPWAWRSAACSAPWRAGRSCSRCW